MKCCEFVRIQSLIGMTFYGKLVQVGCDNYQLTHRFQTMRYVVVAQGRADDY